MAYVLVFGKKSKKKNRKYDCTTLVILTSTLNIIDKIHRHTGKPSWTAVTSNNKKKKVGRLSLFINLYYN